MSDLADAASELEQAERDHALARLRDATAYCESQLFAPVAVDKGRGCRVTECVPVCRECLDPIQPERLKADPRAVRCVDRQIDHERYEAMEARLGG